MSIFENSNGTLSVEDKDDCGCATFRQALPLDTNNSHLNDRGELLLSVALIQYKGKDYALQLSSNEHFYCSNHI